MASSNSSRIHNYNKLNNKQQSSSYLDNINLYEHIQWVSIYLDSKFYITNPQAFRRLQNLDLQIEQQKNKLTKLAKQPQQKAQLKKQIACQLPQKNRNRKNSFTSQISRQCRTQINEIKALKAKIQAQKQLADEQMKFQNKTIQVRKRRSLKDTTFVIRNPKDTSFDKNEQNYRKSATKNFMMGPLQLSGQKNLQQKSRVSESKQSQKLSQVKNQKQSNRYQTIQLKASQYGDKIIAQGGNTIKMSMKSQKKLNFNNLNQNNSKSKEKSFIITSRKASSSNSKQYKESFVSGMKQGDKNKQKLDSQHQIQILTLKLKKMQQKLIQVQKKQKQLEEFDRQKIKKSQASHVSRQNGRRSSKINHSIKSSKFSQQNTINKNKQSIIQPQKSQKIQKSNNNEVVKLQLQKKQQMLPKQPKQYNQQSQIKQKQKYLKKQIIQQKIKRFGINNQLVSYNYTQDIEKQKKIQNQLNMKQRMNDQINQLKRIIKKLKIQKIKQQATIQQLQQQKQKQKKQIQNYVQSNCSVVTFNGTESKAISSIQQLDFSFKPYAQQNNLQQIQMIQIDQPNKEKPLTKKQPRRYLKIQTNQKIKNPSNIYTAQKLNKNNIFSLNSEEIRRNLDSEEFYNPETSSKKDRLNSSSISKRGVIIKQIINKNKFNSSDNFKNEKEQCIKESKRDNQTSIKQLKISIQNQITQEQLKQFEKPFINIPQIEILEGFPIPDLPSVPLAQTSQTQVLVLAKKICEMFQIKINGKQQLQYKKFKNCLVLKSAKQNKAIVWHFSGKFYVGGWNQVDSSGQDNKQGDGFQFIPGKHYYRGQFKNGKRNGFGTMIGLDKNIYKGEWCNGQKHGKGIYYDKNTNTYYQGEWKNGKRDGYGILKISQKQFYEGVFEKLIKSGQGIQLFSNGDLYVGNYKNSKFNGKGKYFWANGSAYIGNFIDGQRQGLGKWRSSQVNGDIYIGQYKKDKKSGKGKYIWANGCKFEGNFIADLKHGEGHVIYQDGRQVKGIWQYGKLKQISKSQKLNEQSFHSLQVQPCIRPNIPKVIESPSRKMQQSKIVQGV